MAANMTSVHQAGGLGGRSAHSRRYGASQRSYCATLIRDAVKQSHSMIVIVKTNCVEISD